MKKLILSALVVVASAVMVQAQESVPSKNVVGYVNLDVPPTGQLLMGAVNFRKVGGGNLTLLEAFGTNQLKQTAFFPQSADTIAIWDTTVPGYKRYYQKTDAKFYDRDTGLEANPEMLPGSSFWIIPATASPDPRTITLMGEVLGADQSSQLLADGLNFINFGYAADFNLASNNNWQTDGTATAFFPQSADNLAIWNGASYDRYYLKADGWYNRDTGVGPLTGVEIPVGQGGWYDAITSFTSVMERPYTYPVD